MLFRIISGRLIQMTLTLAIMKYGLKGECFSTFTISNSNLINYLKKKESKSQLLFSRDNKIIYFPISK